MCVVSMVGDHYRDKWPSVPQPYPGGFTITTPSEVTRYEFEELKKEVLEMKELLKRAKQYDEDNDEPNCEIEDKMDFLRKVAKLVGVDLDDVLNSA